MTRFQSSAAIFFIAVLGLSPATAAEVTEPRTPGQIIAEASAEEWRRPDPEDTLYLELENGRVVIELATTFAPLHATQLRALARERFYDGLAFYRVVDGFVAQMGDQNGDREVKTVERAVGAEFERPLEGLPTFTHVGAEDGFAPETGWVEGFPAGRDPEAGVAWLVHCPGMVMMARGNEPDSGGTELAFMLGHAPRYLDRNGSVFGRVIHGLDLLQKLPRGPEGKAGVIEEPERRTPVAAMRVATDVPEAERTAIEVMRTDSGSFAALVTSRRNRPEEWFVYRADHIDVCGVPIPSRMPPPDS